MKIIQKSLICRCLIKVIRASPMIVRQGTSAALKTFFLRTRAWRPKFRQPISLNYRNKFYDSTYFLSRQSCNHRCIRRITRYLRCKCAGFFSTSFPCCQRAARSLPVPAPCPCCSLSIACISLRICRRMDSSFWRSDPSALAAMLF